MSTNLPDMSAVRLIEKQYTSGEYLEKNPLWHVEESPWKVENIIRMLRKNGLSPSTICDVGCGAGEVMALLQQHMPSQCVFEGYDISPQAIELARHRANDRLRFHLADVAQDQSAHFDLVLALDVLEHLEDYFGFLRDIRGKGEYKIFHIPLDLTVMNVVREGGMLNVRRSFGHLHYFTKETALQTLADTGYQIVDCFYTAVDYFHLPDTMSLPGKAVRLRILRPLRRLVFAASQDMAVRTLGGYRLLVLAR
jgi:SAM-dependent methyltransferase